MASDPDPLDTLGSFVALRAIVLPDANLLQLFDPLKLKRRVARIRLPQLIALIG
jgi:hypothetical protein